MVKIETKEITPVCPYCEKKLETLVEAYRGFFSLNRIICCPHCHKVLGISAGK